ncbi:hypothetical protein ABNM62_19220 [Pseudomonas syringae]|uniref:hypothetical protein n=1 Tax=Pseudomonas syringae TaxID=317 RepID=UPI0032D94779
MEVVLLILILLAPISLSFILIIGTFHKGSFNPSKVLNTLHLDPDRGLVKQPLFWLSIFTPLFYFIATGIVCWKGHEIDISADGLSSFIEISALPLALLSMAIPLGVTVARFHSTEQTAKQISIASNQMQLVRIKNNVDAFYAHRKEFFAFFDKIGKVVFLDAIEVTYQINPRLHGLVFEGHPDAGAPTLDEKLISEIVSKLCFTRRCLDSVLRDTDKEKTLTWYSIAADNIYWIARTLGIREVISVLQSRSVIISGYTETGQDVHFRSIGTTTVQAIAAYRCVKSYVLTILHFSCDVHYIDTIYKGEISHIDTTGGYMHINADGLVIERNMSGESGTPWTILT